MNLSNIVLVTQMLVTKTNLFRLSVREEPKVDYYDKALRKVFDALDWLWLCNSVIGFKDNALSLRVIFPRARGTNLTSFPF